MAAKPRPASEPVKSPTAPRRVLISALRNEGPFLLEWVAYHRAIGFDAIIIAHNDCTDGSAELLAALADLGWVTPLENILPGNLAPQRAAAEVIGRSGLLWDGDWVIWLDLDEYLNIHVGDRTVQSLIDHAGAAKGVMIPWRLFGDSGLASYPGRTISGAYTGAATADCLANNEVKTLFRHGPHIRELAIHRPRLTEGHDWVAADVITAADRPMNANNKKNRLWLTGMERDFAVMDRSDFGWALAQVNHYCVRSPDVFAMKSRRGRGAVAESWSKPRRLRHTDAFYDKMNRNEAEDRSILFWQDKVTALMTTARETPAVAAALDQIEQRFAETQAQAVPEAASLALPDAVITADAAEGTEGDPAAPAVFAPTMWFPDEVKAFVQDRYRAATSILEYGSGGSTVFAARETTARVVSIESDQKWAADLRAYLVTEGIDRPDVTVHWADIGPTRAWGRPRDSKMWGKFPDYPLMPWRDPDFSPDLVLIDGRFRLACLAVTMLHCKRPTTVLIDDYSKRRHYHRAEQLLPVAERIGHMVRFELEPKGWDNAAFVQMLPWFFTVE